MTPKWPPFGRPLGTNITKNKSKEGILKTLEKIPPKVGALDPRSRIGGSVRAPVPCIQKTGYIYIYIYIYI